MVQMAAWRDCEMPHQDCHVSAFVIARLGNVAGRALFNYADLPDPALYMTYIGKPAFFLA